MRSVYDRACSYAYKCSPTLYKDLVHTAWVAHYDKDGSSLFDQDIFIVLRWVKNVWFNEVKRRKFRYEGVYYDHQVYDVDDMQLTGCVSTDGELLTQEFYEEVFRRVDGYTAKGPSALDPKILRQYLELTDLGYKNGEVAVIMGMSHSRISHYKQKIKKMLNDMRGENPYNGPKIELYKRLGRIKKYK